MRIVCSAALALNVKAFELMAIEEAAAEVLSQSDFIMNNNIINYN